MSLHYRLMRSVWLNRSVKYFWLYMILFGIISYYNCPLGVLSVLLAIFYTTWVVVPLNVPQTLPWICWRGKKPKPCLKTVIVKDFASYAYWLSIVPLAMYLSFWYIPLTLTRYFPLVHDYIEYLRTMLSIVSAVPVYMSLWKGMREVKIEKKFMHPTDYLYYSFEDIIEKIAGFFRVEELWHKSGKVIDKSAKSYKKHFIAWVYVLPVFFVLVLVSGWIIASVVAVIIFVVGLYPVYALRYYIAKRRDALKKEYPFLLLTASPIIRLGASIETILRKAGEVGLEQMAKEYKILQYYLKLSRGIGDPLKEYYIRNIPYDRMRVVLDGYYNDIIAGADPTKLIDSEVKYMMDRYEREMANFVDKIRGILFGYVEAFIILSLSSIVFFIMYPEASLMFLGLLALTGMSILVYLLDYVDKNQPYMKFWIRYRDALRKSAMITIPVFVAMVAMNIDPSYVAGLVFFTFMFTYGYYVRHEFKLINDELIGIQTYMMLLNDYFIRGRLPIPSTYEMVRELRMIQNKHFTVLVREATMRHRMGGSFEPMSMRSWFVKMIFRVLEELNVGTHGVRTAMNMIVNNVTTIVNALFDLRRRLKTLYLMIVLLNISLYLVLLLASSVLLQALPMLSQFPGFSGWSVRYSGATVQEIIMFQYIMKVYIVITTFVQSVAVAKAESSTVHNTFPVAFTVLIVTLLIMVLDTMGIGVDYILSMLGISG